MNIDTANAQADVVVVGGGAAGLAAATSLARFRYRVVVVDAGEPRNAPAHGVHNHLSRDGVAPAELLAAGRRDLSAYGAHLVDATVVAVRSAPAAATTSGVAPTRFLVQLSDGRELRARRVIVASGLVDELPPVGGIAQRWGRDVLHCPFCHGWEVRNQRIAVLATEARSLHTALLWRRLSERLTVVLAPGVEPSEAQWQQFAARGIAVVDGVPTELVTAEDRLVGLRLRGGHVVDCDALAITTTMHARVGFLAPLGLLPTAATTGDAVVGTRLETGAAGATAVPGVYVSGNADDLFAQVASSVAAALTTAAAVTGSLVQEDTAAPAGGSFSAAEEAEVCERVLGDRRHGL